MTANEVLVARIADDAWNRGDLAVCDEVMSEAAQYHGPHMPNGVGGRADWQRAIGMYRVAFPDCHVEFEDIRSCEDCVVGRWRATGTQTGAMPGLEATGRRISISGITIYRFSGGKIVEAWEELDMLGMWRQLGVFAPPGHAG